MPQSFTTISIRHLDHKRLKKLGKDAGQKKIKRFFASLLWLWENAAPERRAMAVKQASNGWKAKA